jgi:hypothetical protein
VYRPRFTKRSKPEEHPVYLSSNVALFREAGKELRRRLFDECASISAARFTPGRITRAAREAIRAEEIESVITTRNEALRYLEDNNEFSALLKLADKQYAELKTERDDLELENSALREELASAREENANLKANLQSIWLAQVPESFDGVDIHTDEMDFGSVIDAVSIAEERFRETLVFLKSARTSAEDSSYNDSKRVFHAFAVMDLICRRRREALGRDEKLGRLEDLFSKEGLRYSPHISERTKGHWKEEYEVFYEGRRVPAHDHIKLGNHRNPEYCLRIYFFRDDDKYKFVIAHVGEHKTNTQT